MTTLSVTLPLSIEMNDNQRAYKSDPRNGVALARRVSSRKVRVWRLSWSIAPKGDYELVREAWQLNGSVQAMDWTDPDGNSVRVRFLEAPTVSMLSHSHASFSIALEEVL